MAWDYLNIDSSGAPIDVAMWNAAGQQSQAATGAPADVLYQSDTPNIDPTGTSLPPVWIAPTFAPATSGTDTSLLLIGVVVLAVMALSHHEPQRSPRRRRAR